MKFGYDAEGKLVPLESIKLAEAIAELDAKLNSLSPESRPANVARVRDVMQQAGEVFSQDDESVFALYVEGLLEFTSLQQYFGARLHGAILRRSNGGEDGAA